MFVASAVAQLFCPSLEAVDELSGADAFVSFERSEQELSPYGVCLGGSPVRFGDTHAGGLGIAGGTPAQDAEVAEAALAHVGAQPAPGAQ